MAPQERDPSQVIRQHITRGERAREERQALARLQAAEEDEVREGSAVIDDGALSAGVGVMAIGDDRDVPVQMPLRSRPRRHVV